MDGLGSGMKAQAALRLLLACRQSCKTDKMATGDQLKLRPWWLCQLLESSSYRSTVPQLLQAQPHVAVQEEFTLSTGELEHVEGELCGRPQSVPLHLHRPVRLVGTSAQRETGDQAQLHGPGGDGGDLDLQPAGCLTL